MANARKILIVDDDTDLRDTLVEQLSLHDEFEASAVDTGAKGASAAKANSPDLVLMDVGLPDTDGREVVRSLRKGGFKAPIIMLTGHDTDSDTILLRQAADTGEASSRVLVDDNLIRWQSSRAGRVRQVLIRMR